jgi:hypothetical protein
LEHLDAWSEALIAAGSSPQRIAGVYNVGGGPHLGSGLTVDTAAEQYADKPRPGSPTSGDLSGSSTVSDANRQIRSLVLYVDLVGSRRIWPAQVGCLVDPDGSRWIPSDRLDDQARRSVRRRSMA